MSAKERDVLITLVHGTWGRFKLPFTGPLWFEINSTFSNKLKQSLAERGIASTIFSFVWSGANSIVERDLAAFRLERHLYHQKLDHPNALQIVIGHSHGGTVCMLTAKKLAYGVNPIFVTLATPFMEIINSEETPTAKMITETLSRDGASSAVVIMATSSSIAFMGSPNPFASIAYNLFSLIGLFALGVVPYFLGTRPKEPGAYDLAWLRRERPGPRELEKLTAGGATVNPPRRILVVRGVDDEANFALTVGAIGNRISSIALQVAVKFIRFLARAFLPITAAGLALVIYLVINEGTTGFEKGERLFASWISHPAIVYPSLIAFVMVIVLPFLACLCKSVYGRELAIGGYFCDIKSGSSPDSASGVTMRTLPPGGGGMRHGLHGHELAPSTIAEYVAEQRREA